MAVGFAAGRTPEVAGLEGAAAIAANAHQAVTHPPVTTPLSRIRRCLLHIANLDAFAFQMPISGWSTRVAPVHSFHGLPAGSRLSGRPSLRDDEGLSYYEAEKPPVLHPLIVGFQECDREHVDCN